ncbi:MAG: SDR family oxidoreductase [Betaproteobacteria bacterium]|nr:SDR family oxidoreductase [Betaproteobacteria bacterium]
MRLKGKTALVAGASRNLGKAIALGCAAEGADVVLIASKSSDELKQAADECQDKGVRALPLRADVSRFEEVDSAVRTALDCFGKIDVLMSVAGIRPHKPFLEISHEEWLHVFDVNLHPTFYLAKAIAPGMMARGEGGSIVALGGVSSLTAQPNRAHVVASKTALFGLIKSLALELGPYGIRANLIALGLVDTERRNPEWYKGTGGDPATRALIQRTPLGRIGSPREVVDVAMFLASSESSYVTGDRIVCAGGRYM